MNLPDLELEAQIHAVYEALLAAPERDTKRSCALRLAELVSQRSPQRVRQMERERGLAR